MPTPLPLAEERSDSQRRWSHGPQPASSVSNPWAGEDTQWGKISLHSRDGEEGRTACEDAGGQLLSRREAPCLALLTLAPERKAHVLHECHGLRGSQTGQRRKGFVSFVFVFFKVQPGLFSPEGVLFPLHLLSVSVSLVKKQNSLSKLMVPRSHTEWKVYFWSGLVLGLLCLLGKWRVHLCCQCLWKNNFIMTLELEEVCYLKPGASWS